MPPKDLEIIQALIKENEARELAADVRYAPAQTDRASGDGLGLRREHIEDLQGEVGARQRLRVVRVPAAAVIAPVE